MRLTSLLLSCLLCLLPGFASAQSAGPMRMLHPVPYASNSVIATRIKRECTSLGHEIVFMLNGMQRGKMQLVQGALPTKGPGQVLKLEIVDVYSDGNAFLGHRQGVKLRGVLYRDGSKVAGFTAQRTNTADNLMKACANLDIFAPLFARDISRWLKSPKDGAELGRSWF